jgi:hypothetical protein
MALPSLDDGLPTPDRRTNASQSPQTPQSQLAPHVSRTPEQPTRRASRPPAPPIRRFSRANRPSRQRNRHPGGIKSRRVEPTGQAVPGGCPDHSRSRVDAPSTRADSPDSRVGVPCERADRSRRLRASRPSARPSRRPPLMSWCLDVLMVRRMPDEPTAHARHLPFPAGEHLTFPAGDPTVQAAELASPANDPTAHASVGRVDRSRRRLGISGARADNPRGRVDVPRRRIDYPHGESTPPPGESTAKPRPFDVPGSLCRPLTQPTRRSPRANRLPAQTT